MKSPVNNTNGNADLHLDRTAKRYVASVQKAFAPTTRGVSLLEAYNRSHKYRDALVEAIEANIITLPGDWCEKSVDRVEGDTTARILRDAEVRVFGPGALRHAADIADAKHGDTFSQDHWENKTQLWVFRQGSGSSLRELGGIGTDSDRVCQACSLLFTANDDWLSYVWHFNRFLDRRVAPNSTRCYLGSLPSLRRHQDACDCCLSSIRKDQWFQPIVSALLEMEQERPQRKPRAGMDSSRGFIQTSMEDY